MKTAKQKQNWQSHPGTNTEHFFPEKTPGTFSLCKRASATTGGFHDVKTESFVCSICKKKIQAGEGE